MPNSLARRARLVVLAYRVINAMPPAETTKSDKEVLTAIAVAALDEASKADGPPPAPPRKKPNLPEFLRWRIQNDGEGDASGD